MGQLRNEYNRERNPFGDWEYHPDVLERELLKQFAFRDRYEARARRRGTDSRCHCCDRNYRPEFLASRICRRCAEHVECALCGKHFTPDAGSSGRCCSACRPRLEDLLQRTMALPMRAGLALWREAYVHRFRCPHSKYGA